MDKPYGDDEGYRIIYTKLTHNILRWKAESMVNQDADEGIDIELLRKRVKTA